MVVPRAAGDFGGTLRAARERRGLSLRQIANATKISMIMLEALERNDIARLPGGMFSRAFVRSYALEVGLDPEETIQEFIGQFPRDSVTARPTITQIEDHEAIESDRRMATTFLRLFMISVTVAGIVLYFGATGRRASPPAERRAVASAPREVAPPASSPAPVPAAPQPPATAPSTVVPADRLIVQVVAARPAWVSAIVDGRRAVQRMFQPGDEQTLEVHNEIVLTPGVAGAVTVTLNGAATKPFGKDGQVVSTRVNLMNFKDYLLVP